MRSASRQDAAAKSLIAYFKQRAKKGAPEARRDWLYGPAHVPGGAYDQEAMLDDVIRRAKDIGAADAFELVYVYWRPPVWTCEPSAAVRDKAQQMEFKRQRSANERWAAIAPTGSHNEHLANAQAMSSSVAVAMLAVNGEPIGDPVIARIDAAAIAN